MNKKKTQNKSVQAALTILLHRLGADQLFQWAICDP
jgi:hypothetical protein